MEILEVGGQGLPLAFALLSGGPMRWMGITDVCQSSCASSDLATCVLLACTLHCLPLLQTASVPQFRCNIVKFNYIPSLLSLSYLALESYQSY